MINVLVLEILSPDFLLDALRLNKTEKSAISRIAPSQYLKVEHSSYHKTFVMNPVTLTSAS